MKKIRNLLWAGAIILFCCSIGKAQIIYSNAFNGAAASIYRHVPTFSTNWAGGTSSAWWNVLSNSTTSFLDANGTVGTTLTSDLLPFTPRSGYVYTLTASVTVPAMTAGKWITMGFAATNPFVNTAIDSRFGSTLINGGPWGYLTEGSGGDFFFPTRATSTANAQLMPSPGTYTVQMILDTTASQWTASEFVNGTQIGTTFTYSANPAITAVGIGQTTLTSSTGIQWNYLALSASGSGSTNTINATVSFSPANTGWPLNPAFGGFSYEKMQMITNYFSSNNIPLVKLYSLLGPTVLRIAGATVDTTGWNGISNTIPITTAKVDALAGFIKVLPGNVSVIYGINLLSNTPASAAAEATYAANALGTNLYGFEIGNEPEFGFSSYSVFLPRWRALAAGITNGVPGWAITNGGIGWTLDDADAGQGQLSAYTDPFAANESGVVSLLTQHYYQNGGGLPSDSLPQLLQPDPFLVQLTTNIVGAAKGHSPLGARITECGSFSEGGTLGTSDVYGAALWSLDFMFTVAENGGQGVNFHGGGKSPYSPLNDLGTNITQVGPEFYGLKMFSMLPPGNVIPATVALSSGINFTAYGVREANGAISVLLNNKDVNSMVAVSVNLGTNVAGAQLIELTSPNLFCTNAYTLGGSPITVSGSWTGGVQALLPATNGQLTVNVLPISAFLLIPVLAPPPIVSTVNGNQLTLNWPAAYTGWLLQSNSTGLQNASWFSVPGSSNTNQMQITIQPGQTNVFYRLSSP